MDIPNKLRELANQLEDNHYDIIDSNIKIKMYEEFLLRLSIIRNNVEKKRGQSLNLIYDLIDNFITDYNEKIKAEYFN